MAVTRKQVAMAAAALVTGLSAPAYAGDAGGYVFGSLGVTNFGSFDPDITGADSKKTSSTGLKLGGGYLFNVDKFKVGVEGGYADLGKAKFTFSGVGGGDANLKASALYVAGVGVFPINDQWSVHAKLGLASGSLKISGSAVGTSTTSTGIGPVIGIGGQFDINKQFGVRAEYEMFQAGKKGDKNNPNNNDILAKISMISIGGVFKF